MLQFVIQSNIVLCYKKGEIFMKSRNEIYNAIKKLPSEEQLNFLKEKIIACESVCNYEDMVSYVEVLAYDFDRLDEIFDALPQAYNNAKLYDKTVSLIQPYMMNMDEENAKLFYIHPDSIYYLGVAYHHLQHNELALQCLSMVIQAEEDYINLNSEAADLNDRKLILAFSYAEKGMIFYEQNNYDEAFNLYDKSYSICNNIKAAYFIGHMFYMGESVDKDIDASVNMLTAVADINLNIKHENAIYIMVANYELGVIYATEQGYKNKEKSLERLNKAKELGYEITDKQIKNIVDNIEDDSAKPNSDKSSKKNGCYIATCVYGSYDCSPVWTLRRFRDDILSESFWGKTFIKLYYWVSPTLVKIFGKTLWFHKMWKPLLDKIVQKLSDRGIENTPYKDREEE